MSERGTLGWDRAALPMAFVRLGRDSEDAIRAIDSTKPTSSSPLAFEIRCKQVPREVVAGVHAVIWLGTNNNKGGSTPWTQGLRAFGTIDSVEGPEEYNATKQVRLSVALTLTRSLTKKDFVRAAGADYINIADLPVVGINNYSSQVVQMVDRSDVSQRLDILLKAIAALEPQFMDELRGAYPDIAQAADVVAEVSDQGNLIVAEALSMDPPAGENGGDESDDKLAELLAQVTRLLRDGYGGVIFRGAPGTSKSWYARRIAEQLVNGELDRLRAVQFHPSYQYEDFVEGYVPDPGGTFVSKAKHLVEMCEVARADIKQAYVLLIDEFSRADPARVFGEALTYIEASKRSVPFQTASGRQMVVPSNLIVLATMNVWDRGVDEVDAAVERRFASIALDPDSLLLEGLLRRNQVEEFLARRIRRLFQSLQSDPNHAVHIGHAYFRSVRDESSLQRLWDHQVRFLVERAFPLEKDGIERIAKLWRRAVMPAESESDRGPDEGV